MGTVYLNGETKSVGRKQDYQETHPSETSRKPVRTMVLLVFFIIVTGVMMVIF